MFADTSAVAEAEGEIVGFVAGFMPPERRTTLFVWQVAVSDRARGQGLALQMLKDIVSRMHWWRLQYVQASITEDNEASWKLFTALAKTLNAPYDVKLLFEADRHFAGTHPTEHLITIGPIGPTHLSALRLGRSKVHAR